MSTYIFTTPRRRDKFYWLTTIVFSTGLGVGALVGMDVGLGVGLSVGDSALKYKSTCG
jgi:hypothetical protein